ncbi:sensor histidine kinase [Pseudomonas sp. Irchel 3A5]|uniref:sensor histidine kinase n=1 Tax=Pseudomonas sp. Irchel 3A5 TaxID=2008911 RepID=UPI001595B644|nr:histidine kinase dimerization/phosphoacceptor domain -containing protein [Pseudomonas sp. Irchel 3A5]
MKFEPEETSHPATLGELEFRELADHAPVMIWRARSDKHCDWFNKPWTDFTGKSQQQLCGYGWKDDVHPEDLDACMDAYDKAFDERIPFRTPYRVRRHDGEYRWMLDSGAPFYRDGQFAGYFGSCVDITEQREMAENQQALLAELNHRVKNNLQLIISLLQLSSLRAQGEEAKNLMQSAISRVVGIGAVQEQLHRNSRNQVDLAQLLPDLARGVIDTQYSRPIALSLQTQPVYVSLQIASNMGLILNELLDNAIKHSNGSGIDLQIAPMDPETARICICDQGPGFSDEVLSAFSASGTPLALSLVDALSKRCGATVQRSNKQLDIGHGAQVELMLKLDPTH